MGKLTCGCLNVQIHAKKSTSSRPSLNQLGINEDAKDDFFTLDICEGLLDLEGITIIQPCLIKKRLRHGWIINECANCEMMTHAVPSVQGATSKILLNQSLKGDINIIERLSKSSDFSKLYHINLTSRNDNHPKNLGLQTGKFESLQETLTTIQTSLNKFLMDEEAAMEERIRIYDEEQRSAFAELQSKARRDKNAMINLVLSMETDSKTPQGNQKGEERITHTSHTNQGTTLLSGMQSSNTKSAASTNTTKVIKAKPVVKTVVPRQMNHFMPEVNDNADTEALFDLDELQEDDTRPFYASDDENDTDDSSSLSEEGFDGGVMGNKSIYSSSVPISVPAWRLKPNRSSIDDVVDEEDFDRRGGIHGEDIAASMQALARSVHCDGTEMFGDRPRPRLNTLDMGKI